MTEFSVLKRSSRYLSFLKDTGSLTMTGNLFGIHWIATSKVIHKVFLDIAKHVAFKSVLSAFIGSFEKLFWPKTLIFFR